MIKDPMAQRSGMSPDTGDLLAVIGFSVQLDWRGLRLARKDSR
jgi:hypothetical protein